MNATALPHDNPPRVAWKSCLLLFLAVFLFAVPQAALLPLLDRDEPRFAEAAREMVQSGNYVVPTFNGKPRYAKPPLIYWSQIAAYQVFGENAFAARLPSLLATASTAVLLLTWGTRLGSEAAGLGAGLSYAFCLQTIQQGRVATADALLIFFMTLAAFTGWLILRRRPSQGAPWLCYGVLGLAYGGGFLAKGPEAFLPFIPQLGYAFMVRRHTVIGFLASLLAGLTLVAFWAIPAYIETHGDYWWHGLDEGIGQRVVVGLQGHGASSVGGYILSLPYYVVLFWLSALPWSLLIIFRARRLFRDWKPDPADLYLLAHAGLIFAVFTLMATKLPHYTLPAFPLLALVLVRRWQEAGLSPGMFTQLGWITAALFALLALIALPLARNYQVSPSPVGELVRAAGNQLKPETSFAIVDFQEPNAVWEMRQVCHGYAQPLAPAALLAFLREDGPRAVLISSSLWQSVADANTPAGFQIFTARGFNAAKGSLVELTLVVKS